MGNIRLGTQHSHLFPPLFRMNRTVLAVLSLSQMSTTEKITKGHYMVQCFKANQALFPKTAPATDVEMADVLARLSAAHTATQSKSTLAYAQEQEVLVQYDAIFGAYRDWANQPDVAADNKVKIEQLGLDVSRDAQARGPMPVPVLRQPAGEVEGELDLVCDKIDGCVALVWMVAYGDEMPADDDFRYCTAGTKMRQTLTLKSGLVAWVRVLAVGPQGPGPMSAAVKRRVL